MSSTHRIPMQLIHQAVGRRRATMTLGEQIEQDFKIKIEGHRSLTAEEAERLIHYGHGIVTCLGCGAIDPIVKSPPLRPEAYLATELTQMVGTSIGCCRCGAVGILAPDENGRAFVNTATPLPREFAARG